MREGRVRFEQGGFAQAAVHWMTAARLYEEGGQLKEQCQALINLSHALQKEGQIRRAQGALQTALKLSESMGNRLLTATILGQLGTTSHLLGKEDSATEHLTKALTLARSAIAIDRVIPAHSPSGQRRRPFATLPTPRSDAVPFQALHPDSPRHTILRGHHQSAQPLHRQQ